MKWLHGITGGLSSGKKLRVCLPYSAPLPSPICDLLSGSVVLHLSSCLLSALLILAVWWVGSRGSWKEGHLEDEGNKNVVAFLRLCVRAICVHRTSPW